MSSGTMGIKLTEATKSRLRALGDKMDRSTHWIMKTAIERYLTEQERYWQERQEDLERWESYLYSGEGVAHEEVAQWLDSIGTDDERPCPR